MHLAFDTETTGLPLFHDPSDDPRQPHLIQLAAILVDDAGNEIDTYSTIVKPGAGAVMEPKAFEAHGISLERAHDEGVPGKDAAERFLAMVEQAMLIIGHNVSFDVRIMRIHAARFLGAKWDNPLPAFCTMRKATNIIKLPPTDAMKRAGRFYSKPPKLEECIKHFFNEPLEGAHDALIDVRASLRVFNHLVNSLGVALPAPKAPVVKTAPLIDNPFAQAGA